MRTNGIVKFRCRLRLARRQRAVPMLTRNLHRRAYVPPGLWYGFWAGDPVQGGRWPQVTAALDRIPVYVRAGVALPLAAVVQCTDELAGKALTWRIYPDEAGRAGYELAGPAGTRSLSARIVEGRLALDPVPGANEIEAFGAAKALIPVR